MDLTRLDLTSMHFIMYLAQCILSMALGLHIITGKNELAKLNGEVGNLVRWSRFIISIFTLQCPFMSLGCKIQLMKSCSVTYKLKRVTNKVKVCQKTLNQEIRSALLFYTVLIHTFSDLQFYIPSLLTTSIRGVHHYSPNYL